VPCPEDLQAALDGAAELQFTLIDCPGHASLIKTILVGAQIMDITILVVDATKGVQAQTAECIILGELLSSATVVALNKIDLFSEDKRKKAARKAGRAVLDALRLTRFADSELVPVAAKPEPQGMDELKAALLRNLPRLLRRRDAPFLFMADHCFCLKGHGTVLSGVLRQPRSARATGSAAPGVRRRSILLA
jgi:selenocysteine-specific elongation factor